MNGYTYHAKGLVEVTVELVDKTGSMKKSDYSPSRMEAAKQAAVEFIGRKRQLDIRDRNCVVGFDTQPRLVSPFGRHPYEAKMDVMKLSPDGGTNITAALRLALDLVATEVLMHKPRPQGRVILLSDGEHNTGPSPWDDGVLDALKRAGIVVDCILIGGYEGERLLRDIAGRTGGQFTHCRDFMGLIRRYNALAEKKPRPA